MNIDFLPKELQNIIFKYLHQLSFKKVLDEMKTNVEYYYSSPHFSEIKYKNKTITYYISNDKLLVLYKNYHFNKNKINSFTLMVTDL